ASAPRKESGTPDKAGGAAADRGPRPAAEPARKADASAANSQFVVQVAALADADKARELRQELVTRGLKVYTEKVKAPSGQVTRVPVGPFPSREAGEKERERLKSLGFEGNVAPR